MVYLITGCFILMDLVTGLIKAFKNKEYTSSIMREGLYHKAGSVLCVLFGVLVDHAQTIVDLGVTVPITLTICGYIILMEICYQFLVQYMHTLMVTFQLGQKLSLI